MSQDDPTPGTGSAPPGPEVTDQARPARRDLLSALSWTAMAAGVLASYGTLAAMAARFLYPTGRAPRRWMFVARVDDVEPGRSLVYSTPAGLSVTIARRDRAGSVGDFIALSNTCPHLGCQVRWEPQDNRFFCPCHNGAFDPDGKAIGGPPREAGQRLGRFGLKIEKGLLFMEVEVLALARGDGGVEPPGGPPGPGHDPCLFRRSGPTAG